MVRIEQYAQAMLDRSGPLYDDWVRKSRAGYQEWLDFAELLGQSPPAAKQLPSGD